MEKLWNLGKDALLDFYNYCSNTLMLKSDLNSRLFLSYTVGYGCIFSLRFIQSNLLDTISFITISIIIMLINYETSIISASIHGIVLTTSWYISRLFCQSALKHIYRLGYGSGSISPDIVVVMLFATLYIIIFLIIVMLISCFGKKDVSSKSHLISDDLLLLGIPVFSLFIVFSFLVICRQTDLSTSITILILFICLFTLMINTGIFTFFNHIKKREKQLYEFQLQLQKESDMHMYNKMMMKHSENQHILIHDIKKHLLSLSYLNQKHENEKIEQYISQLLDSASLKTSLTFCDHPLLNAILFRYQTLASEKHLVFYTDIRSKCVDFIQDSDITSLFCNLLDNAFESVDMVTNGYIELSVTREKNDQLTLIVLKNSCLQSPFSSKSGKLITTRKQSSFHGYGIKSIQKIVSSLNGMMDMSYREEDQMFHAVIALPRPTKNP